MRPLRYSSIHLLSVSTIPIIRSAITTNQRVVFVSHADGDKDRVRIISAREITRRETYDYQERSRKNQ